MHAETTWYETDFYRVITGEGTDPTNPGPCYISVNKDSGIHELESKILPQIMDFTDQLTEQLVELKSKEMSKASGLIPKTVQ